MVRIIAFIRPYRLEQVKSAIAALGVSGLTVADVRGVGDTLRPAGPLPQAGTMPIQSRLEVCVSDDLSAEVVDAIERNAHTGEPGDGKIFVERLLDAIRIRTSERGELAI